MSCTNRQKQPKRRLILIKQKERKARTSEKGARKS
jgi:hypothetical protein